MGPHSSSKPLPSRKDADPLAVHFQSVVLVPGQDNGLAQAAIGAADGFQQSACLALAVFGGQLKARLEGCILIDEIALPLAAAEPDE